MKEKYKYLGKNTIVFAISSFGTKFLAFLFVPLYTNILSTAEYGIADIITTSAMLMIYLFTINIADAVLRFALEKKENQNGILAYGIRVILIGSVIAIVVLAILSLFDLKGFSKEYYVFMFAYFFFTALYQLLTNYLRAIDYVFEVAVAGIISAIFMFGGNIVLLVVIRTGIRGYLISLAAGPFAGCIYCLWKIRLPIIAYFQRVCDITIQKEMKSYCIPLIFNNLALWINAFLDKYFVMGMRGAAENGVYAVSYKIPTILSTCYLVFSQAWNLSAMKEFDPDDNDGFFSETYRMYNVLTVFLCCGLIFLNVPLAKLLFAKDFFVAWKYSSVLLISILFNALTAFLGSIFVAVKDSKSIAITTIISAIVNIGLNIILIPIWGAQGAAIATASCYAVMWAIRFVIARKYITLRISIWVDLLAYALLCLQVVLEHQKGHCYGGQILIVICIMGLYIKNIVKMIKHMGNKLVKRG